MMAQAKKTRLKKLRIFVMLFVNFRGVICEVFFWCVYQLLWFHIQSFWCSITNFCCSELHTVHQKMCVHCFIYLSLGHFADKKSSISRKFIWWFWGIFFFFFGSTKLDFIKGIKGKEFQRKIENTTKRNKAFKS